MSLGIKLIQPLFDPEKLIINLQFLLSQDFNLVQQLSLLFLRREVCWNIEDG